MIYIALVAFLLFLLAFPWYRNYAILSRPLQKASGMLVQKQRLAAGSSRRSLPYLKQCTEAAYFQRAEHWVPGQRYYFYTATFRLENGEERVFQLPYAVFQNLKAGAQAQLTFQRDVVRGYESGEFSFSAPYKSKSSCYVDAALLLLLLLLACGALWGVSYKQQAWSAQLSSGVEITSCSPSGWKSLAEQVRLPSLAQARPLLLSYNKEGALLLFIEAQISAEALPPFLLEAESRYPLQSSGAEPGAPDYLYSQNLALPALYVSQGEIQVFLQEDGSARVQIKEAYPSKKLLNLFKREAGFTLF